MKIIDKLKHVRHRISHKFGCNLGVCHSFYENGDLMMSFKCDTCGELSGIHKVERFFEAMEGELNEKLEKYDLES